MLRLVLPKGSLEEATLKLSGDADLPVRRESQRSYLASIDDPRVASVRILRPQEIPTYVAEGLFDIGITGRDWIEETSADVVTLSEFTYSKNTTNPIRVVLAVGGESGLERAEDLKDGVRVSTEYPNLTRRYFERLGIRAHIYLSYGATEAKIPDIVDVIVENTETGSSLRAAGLRVIDTILTSYTELIAHPASFADAGKRRAMEQIRLLLQGALTARGKVLVKLNVAEDRLADVLGVLPALHAPTVSPLAENGFVAVETVVPKSEINLLIPRLSELGAEGILEIPISKIVD